MSAALGAFVLDHVQSRYQPMKSAPEYLARAANVTPATAINWLRRKCTPQADNIGELCRNDPEFKAALISWLQREEL